MDSLEECLTALFQSAIQRQSAGVDGRLLDIFQSILATDPSSMETHQQCASILINLVLKHPEAIDGSDAHTGWHSLFGAIKLLSPLDCTMNVLNAFSRLDTPQVLLPMAIWEYGQTLCYLLKESPDCIELYGLVRKLHSTLMEWAGDPNLLDGTMVEAIVSRLRLREQAYGSLAYGASSGCWQRRKIDADLPPLSSLLPESNDYELFPSELDRDPRSDDDDGQTGNEMLVAAWAGDAKLCVWELVLSLVEGLCPLLYQIYIADEYPAQLLPTLYQLIVESSVLGKLLTVPDQNTQIRVFRLQLQNLHSRPLLYPRTGACAARSKRRRYLSPWTMA